MADISLPIGLPSAETDSPSAMASLSAEAAVLMLFDAHRSQLFRYVLAFGLSAHDSEDIVQEVFLALFHHLQRGKPRNNLLGWLFRVAHNLALKRRIQQKPGNTLPLDALLPEACTDPSPTPEQHLAFRQRQERLLAVVRALPEQEERCLRLRAEGLKYREIAEALGISLGSVAMALTRSLARLQRADQR